MLIPLLFMKIRHAQESAHLVRWEFARNHKHLMCAIRATAAPSSYEVAIVPMWDVGQAAIETFTTAGAALRRHAAIAADLRDAGWTVASYTSQVNQTAAA
jgi:hypothetical protein